MLECVHVLSHRVSKNAASLCRSLMIRSSVGYRQCFVILDMISVYGGAEHVTMSRPPPLPNTQSASERDDNSSTLLGW